MRALILAAATLFAASTGFAQADPVGACDRLAGNPTDPGRVGVGVTWTAMDAAAAIPACRAAVAAAPDLPRVRYELGRALDRAGSAEEALVAYRAAAAAGYGPALNAVGYFSEEGVVVAQDFARALENYEAAAAAGFPDAVANIGYLYQHGRGVPADPAEAARRYAAAATQGVAWAARTLGYMYEQGDGIARDEVEAVRWYRIAAEGGDMLATNNLGSLYLDGRGGLVRDPTEAARLFGVAAAGGEAIGLHNLARMAQYGMVGPADPDKAESLFRDAIAGGWEPAKNGLAWLLAVRGVKLDEAEGLAREMVAATPDPSAERAGYADTLAWVLFRQGRLDEAAATAAEAVALDATRPALFDHLGDILAALGRDAEARAAWRAALAQQGDGDLDWDRAATERKLGE